MLEYVLVFVALIAVVWALSYFVSAARKNAKQTAEDFRPEAVFRQWECYLDSVLDRKEAAP